MSALDWVTSQIDSDLNTGGRVLVFVGFAPVMCALFFDQSWLIPSVALAAIWFGFVLRRWYLTTRAEMRPVDVARDAWAAKHQSSEYRQQPDDGGHQ